MTTPINTQLPTFVIDTTNSATTPWFMYDEASGYTEGFTYLGDSMHRAEIMAKRNGNRRIEWVRNDDGIYEGFLSRSHAKLTIAPK